MPTEAKDPPRLSAIPSYLLRFAAEETARVDLDGGAAVFLKGVGAAMPLEHLGNPPIRFLPRNGRADRLAPGAGLAARALPTQHPMRDLVGVLALERVGRGPWGKM